MRWLVPALALILVGLVYGPALHDGYVWDDVSLFIHSDALRNDTKWLEGLVQPILAGSTYFRPLVLATFAAEFRLWAVDPFFSHLVNVCIHLLNVALVGVLALKISGVRWRDASRNDWLCIGLAQLLFGLHPALIESVTWVAGRFDLLATTFFLLYVVVALTDRLSGQKLLLLPVIYLAGLLCKEMMVTAPAIVVVLYLLAPNVDRSSLRARVQYLMARKAHWLVVGAVTSLGVYVFLKLYFMGVPLHEDKQVSESWSGLSRLSLIGETVMFYVRMVVWPFSDINPQHPMVVEGQSFASLLLYGVVGLVLLFFVLATPMMARPGHLAVSAVLIAFLPVLNVIPLTIGGNIGHDRFLTLPVAILAPLLVTRVRVLLAEVKRDELLKLARGGVVAMACGWLLLSAANVRVTVPLWQSEFTLWSWAAQKHGDFAFVRQNYVSALIERGLLDQAMTEVNRPLNDAYGAVRDRTYFDLMRAHILLRKGDLSTALKTLEGIHLEADELLDRVMAKGVDVRAWHVAKISRAGLESALVLHTFKAEVLIGLRRFDEAEHELDRAAFIDPESQGVQMLRAFALYGAGKRDAADSRFEGALSMMTPAMKQGALYLRGVLFSQLCLDRVQRTSCTGWIYLK